MPRKKRVEAAETEAAAKKNETKKDKFIRLAEARTSAALKRIELLGNLASPGYEYDNAQAQQILDAMFDAVHDLKRKFEKAKSRKDGGKKGFTFRSKTPSAEMAA